MKKEKFDQLFIKMSHCNRCQTLKKKNGTDCSLVNIFQNEEFYKNIPSIWTDWYNRLNSKIMIIGQDWGPYNDMMKFHDAYVTEKNTSNWEKIMECENSLTKKMLTKFLIESASIYNINLDNNFINKIFITNAIMCARKGHNYRGDNIKLKESTLNCCNYLKEQIEIVKPKIILTLGYYPLLSLSKIFYFKIDKSLSSTIKSLNIIKVDNYIIIPLYHPTAQIKKEKQLEQYKKIWENIDCM